MAVTIYKNISSTDFHYIKMEDALNRIKSGKSLEAVKRVRDAKTKEDTSEAKKVLPCVCFSGKFGSKHKDEELTEHSGFIILDFDHVGDPEKKKDELKENPFIYACWVSPSGDGVKALVKIADPSKHRQHFAALKTEFPDADQTGGNPSRLCFESYDPDLHLNSKSDVWTKTVQTEQVYLKGDINKDDQETFEKLLKWMAHKGKAFQSGERNSFVFIIASACCKFGIAEERAVSLISFYVSSDSDFSAKETRAAIRSAYRRNASVFNSAEFEAGRFIDKTTRKEVSVKITHEEIEELNKQNVTYGKEVDSEVMDLYVNGYKTVYGIEVPELDNHYKRKTGELTSFTGYGNMGKSTYWLWYLTMRAIIFDERAAIFSPETGSAAEFYFEIIEIFCGSACNKGAYDRPDEETFKAASEWVYDHFFCVEPKDISPTPEVIKETFLAMIVGKGVKTVVIDPFNQLSNDYGSAGGRSDKYLETFLADCGRFARQNGVNFDIVAHPKTPREKDAKGDYTCPDQFSIADGTMWNNKCDNILVYHRPTGFSDPDSGQAEIHSKKIRRQKIVGRKGFVEIYYSRSKRRFLVNNVDHMELAKQKYLSGKKVESGVRPNINFFESSQSIVEYSENPYENDPLNPESY